MKKSIKDLGNIKGKRALVRVDVNVPLDENKNVTDDTRFRAILPTVNALKEKGAKDVYVCATHPVFSGPALERLEKAPIEEVVVTNSERMPITENYNKIK